jgi:pimeloyl-ACP methyl ester carboxylesterase
MPHVVNRACKIAYDVTGSGPAVVLLPGMTSRRGDFATCGYVDVLRDGYTVVAIDSLGHGDSDKPTDCALYRRDQRAGDVVAVLDDLGIERAHLFGYSMGSWVASGVLVHYPSRVSSVVLGGWDPIGGLDTARRFYAEQFGLELTFERLLGFARRQLPEQVAWITPEIEPAIRCCWEAVNEIDGVEPVLAAFDRPVLLWDGDQDPYRGAAEDVAARYAHIDLLVTAGDHVTAFFEADEATRRALRTFIDSAPS